MKKDCLSHDHLRPYYLPHFLYKLKTEGYLKQILLDQQKTTRRVY